MCNRHCGGAVIWAAVETIENLGIDQARVANSEFPVMNDLPVEHRQQNLRVHADARPLRRGAWAGPGSPGAATRS